MTYLFEKSSNAKQRNIKLSILQYSQPEKKSCKKTRPNADVKREKQKYFQLFYSPPFKTGRFITILNIE